MSGLIVDAIKPCPFCAEPQDTAFPGFAVASEAGHLAVCCKLCGGRGPIVDLADDHPLFGLSDDDRAGAIEEWNRRGDLEGNA